MPKAILLPIKDPLDPRETLIYIPGAERMSRQKLQELIAWQTEKTLEEYKQMGRMPKAIYPREQVVGALKDFMGRLKLAQQRRGGRYF